MSYNTIMFIKHNKFMDICIEFTKKPIRLPNGDIKIRGQYWNMGVTESYPLNIPCRLRLTPEQQKNLEFTIDITNTLRTANWQPYHSK